MDAFALFPYGIAGLAFGAAGYVLGKLQRELRYRREAVNNLALANQRAIDRANARANRNRNTDADTLTNDDDGAAFALANVRDGHARRRAVSRPHNGPRPGRYAARRDSDLEYETAMTGAGHDSL